MLCAVLSLVSARFSVAPPLRICSSEHGPTVPRCAAVVRLSAVGLTLAASRIVPSGLAQIIIAHIA